METRVYVALGSNQGDRVNNLRQAIAGLTSIASSDIDQSSFYLTDPLDMEDDAEEFANAVVGFKTSLTPWELLAATREIEVNMGRPVNHGRNESRVIDIDIILYGNEVVNEADLIIPHPRAHERAFVLMPLAEIAPHAADRLRGNQVQSDDRGG
ncbi:MAG: 2-amino-4-hydroxy-6-hydroxymethyldihydropteridine diphosphokinase [Pseudomonadales bacterium]